MEQRKLGPLARMAEREAKKILHLGSPQQVAESLVLLMAATKDGPRAIAGVMQGLEGVLKERGVELDYRLILDCDSVLGR